MDLDRLCIKCGKIKNKIIDFHFRSKKQINVCKDCHNALVKQYKKKNLATDYKLGTKFNY